MKTYNQMLLVIEQNDKLIERLNVALKALKEQVAETKRILNLA